MLQYYRLLSVPYKSWTQRTEFVNYINQVLFDKKSMEKIQKKIIAVFWDGNTDSVFIEKNASICFCHPDTLEPVLTIYSLKDLPNQGADGIKSTTGAAFNDISMQQLAN